MSYQSAARKHPRPFSHGDLHLGDTFENRFATREASLRQERIHATMTPVRSSLSRSRISDSPAGKASADSNNLGYYVRQHSALLCLQFGLFTGPPRSSTGSESQGCLLLLHHHDVGEGCQRGWVLMPEFRPHGRPRDNNKPVCDVAPCLTPIESFRATVASRRQAASASFSSMIATTFVTWLIIPQLSSSHTT
jgi:hypothetical protein